MGLFEVGLFEVGLFEVGLFEVGLFEVGLIRSRAYSRGTSLRSYGIAQGQVRAFHGLWGMYGPLFHSDRPIEG